MRVHVGCTHAARLVRFVAHRAHERPFVRVHSRVNGQFADLRKRFAAKLADVPFALGLENVVAERFFREEFFVCKSREIDKIRMLKKKLSFERRFNEHYICSV